jgi:16S rRNA G966 N2-methylase RsmD
MYIVMEIFLKSTKPVLPILDKQDIYSDFEKLRVSKPVEESLTREGCKVSNFFFREHRIQARLVSHPTFAEIMKSTPFKKRIIEKAQRLNKTKNPSIHQIYGIIRFYHGIASQFRPSVAKFLYDRFHATKVLDPCAGWGDRLVGALASENVKSYIGIDSNLELKKSYTLLTKEFAQGKKVKMIFKPFETVDVSKLEYDFVFTSPPYYTKEKYHHMPSYSNYKDWHDTFLKPLIERAYRFLKPGGFFCLNIELPNDNDIIKIFKGLGARKCKTLKYMVHNRKANVKYSRFEPIYVYKKVQT